jgi:uncharacterized membrane protein YoaK (UPF0700 family)
VRTHLSVAASVGEAEGMSTTARGPLTQYLAHPEHGPLPGILLLMTVSTGLVDAISILALGRVFVANMTGNIVFIGFALARAPGFSLSGSLVALVTFLIGAALGGVLVKRLAGHRGRLLRTALAVELVLFLVCLLTSVTGTGTVARLVILGVAAAALGAQNAVVRELAVPDMTTTVLTMTLTGIGSDLRKRDLSTAGRRLVVVIAMLLGAVIGALLVDGPGVPAAFVVVVVVTAAALVSTSVTSHGSPSWALRKG